MAMEVVWTRAFAPVLKTQVYSFAAVLTAYLGATFAGSWLYRRHLRRRTLGSTAQLVSLRRRFFARARERSPLCAG